MKPFVNLLMIPQLIVGFIAINIYHGITPLWEAIVCLKDPHLEWGSLKQTTILSGMPIAVCLGHIKIVGWTIWHFVQRRKRVHLLLQFVKNVSTWKKL
jgi:hypothetical protein